MGESKKAFRADEDVKLRTHVGGQALIEGIMMRGRYNWAVAVRQPDGSIYTEEHDLASGRDKNAWMRLPVIRGCTAFVESLALGYKALDIAAEHAYDLDELEDEDAKGADVPEQVPGAEAADDADTSDETAAAVREAANGAEEAEPPAPAGAGAAAVAEADGAGAGDDAPAADGAEEEGGGLGVLMTVSMLLGIVLGIVIFMLVPAAVSNAILGADAMNGAAWNVLDGVLRIAIFVAYIWLISLMKDINRMFRYHGAEHKTIHCYEHGLDMTPENARTFPRLHVRCGTAFTIMVLIIAIFVYTVLGGPINALVAAIGITNNVARFIAVLLIRILLLPLIAGVSYEITVKWAGQRPDNWLVKIVLWPGMQMQRITTKEPDEGMLECAICAMNIVLAREDAEAAKAQADGDAVKAETAAATGCGQ